MTSGLPAAAAYNASPLQNALRAQSVAASAMAIYLIGGGALVAAALVSAAYSEVLHSHWPQGPALAIASALLWGLLGGWAMHRLQTHVKACHQAYDAHLQQLAHTRRRPTGMNKIRQLFSTPPAPPAPHPAMRHRLPISLFGSHLSCTPQPVHKL